MKEALKVTRISFDNMENSVARALVKKDIGVFITDENGLAHKKVKDWFLENGNEKLFLGWDGEVYPKFKVEEVSVT